jgi:hypothetical protein
MAMDNRLMRPKKSGAAPFVYNAEALAWETAAIANGGTVSTSTLQAVSTFCDAIDAAGIRSKFLRLNLVSGGNLAAARTPLYRGASSGGTQYGATYDVNNGPFVSADYTESTGLTGNNATKYFDTGLTIGTVKTFGADYDDVHVSLYNRTSNLGPHFGGYYWDGYGNGLAMGVGQASDASVAESSPVFRVGQANYGEGELFGTSAGFGLHFAEKTASAAGVYFRNNTDITGTLTPYGSNFDSNDGTEIFFMAAGFEVGAAPPCCDGSLSAYSVGKSLGTAAARTAFRSAMITFQTTLGRNV